MACTGLFWRNCAMLTRPTVPFALPAAAPATAIWWLRLHLVQLGAALKRASRNVYLSTYQRNHAYY